MTAVAGRHVLVVGYSTRAIAESAARAGFRVTAIDAFADLDQHSEVQAIALPAFSPHSAVEAGRAVACDAVAYLSSFENHSDEVRALACGRVLWGNTPDTLQKVRDPHTLADALLKNSLHAPRLGGDGDCRWLLKPVASGGGTRIVDWRRGSNIPQGFYLQEFIEGEPWSVSFVASRDGIRVLGLSRQLMGGSAFGASGYRYCGSLLDDARDPGLMRDATRLAEVVARAFDLVGVNGIDFIVRDGVLYPIEVNPRWSASMELVERSRGVSVFGAHAAACASGDLPAFDALSMASSGRTIGKAVVFARHNVNVQNTTPWLTRDIRDVPRPGSRIESGDPVCTVFADGSSPEACLRSLEARAADVFDELARWAARA